MNAPERNLRIGHGQFDPLSGDLTLGGRSARLRPRTSVLLGYLLSHPDRVVGKDELMQAVWPDVVVTEDSLVKCVKEIRQALGEEGRDWIRTSPRQGYAFVGAPAAPLPAQPVPSPPAALPDRQRRFRVAAGAMAALVLVFAVGLVGWQQTDLSSTAYPTHSLVVLPVVNQTGDPARDNAVDDLTEALIDSLGTIHRATVIAPGTAFQYKGRAADARSIGRELKVRYLLAGTLRMNGDRTVLAARLVSTETAVLLLSQDFPLGPGGMPELREDVLDGVAITLGLRLVHAEAERSGRAEAIRAAETLSQARSILRWQPDAAGVAKARALLEEAVRDDPRLPLGWAMLASTYLHDARFNAEREQQLKRAAEAIARAVAIAPDSAAVRMIEGRVLYEQGSMPQALAAFERCIEINPSHAWAHGLKAAALVMLGRPQEAFAPLDKAMRLSPNDSLLASWWMYGGVAHLHLGHEQEAVRWLAEGVKAAPRSAFGHLFLAGALGAAGRIPEAREEVAQLLRLHPGYTLARFKAAEPSRAPAFLQQRERLYEGLRRAGLQE